MTTAEQARANRTGIAWMVLAMTAFIANDAITKSLGAHLSAAQIIVVRGVMAISLISLVAWRMGAMSQLPDVVRPWVILRAACEGLGTFLYLAALFHLPFANVSAINQSSPLFIALLAMVLLKERVDAGRWIAIGIGFVGVLAVIQPRLDGFNLYAWMTLLATFIFACRDLLTRKVPMATPSILVTLTTASVVWLMACGVLAVQGWTPMSARDVGLLSIAAVLLSTAYYASIAAMRQGEMSVVAPFRYVGLFWALLIGWFVWGDLPNAWGLIGISLLIATGVYMIRHQRAAGRS